MRTAVYAKLSLTLFLALGLFVATGAVQAQEDHDQPAGDTAEAGHDEGAENAEPDHGEEEADHGHGAGHGEHHTPIGAKGVDTSPAEFKSDLAIFTLIVFVLLFLLLRQFAWGPIVDGLEKREGAIAQQIADAEAAHEKAKAMLAEHEYKMDKVQDEVREILAEARRDAEHTREEMIAAAQAETEAMKNRAVTDIERARDEALDQLFSHMAESVAQATEHVLGRAINESDDRQLIDDALAKFTPSEN